MLPFLGLSHKRVTSLAPGPAKALRPVGVGTTVVAVEGGVTLTEADDTPFTVTVFPATART